MPTTADNMGMGEAETIPPFDTLAPWAEIVPGFSLAVAEVFADPLD
jgi:hypothetical protein